MGYRRQERLREIEHLRVVGESLSVTVVRVVSGGLIVDAGTPAFLPRSLVDVVPVTDLEQFVGQRFDVLVEECNLATDKLVVSRRSYLERARRIQADRTLRATKAGDILEGVVRNVGPLGIFMVVDGVDGLVPPMEIGWTINENFAHDHEIGDRLRVSVEKVVHDKRQFNLSLRNVADDPWPEYDKQHYTGQLVWCRAVSVLPHAVYFEMAPGVYGFAHVSELSERIVRQAGDVVSVGDEMWLKITGHDPSADYREIGIRIFPDMFRPRKGNRTPFSHFNNDGSTKAKYRTYADADERIRVMYEHGHNGNLLYSYRCTKCNHWHFGGTASERWTLSKVRAELEGGEVAPEWATYYGASDESASPADAEPGELNG